MMLEYDFLYSSNDLHTCLLYKGFLQSVKGLIRLQLIYFQFYGNIQFRNSICPEMERNQTILSLLPLTLLHIY